MDLLLWFYVWAGLLLAILSIPLIMKRVPPNGLYGFRLGAAMDDERLWYVVNHHLGVRLLWAGLVISIASLFLYTLPGIDVETFSLASLGVGGIALGIAVIQSYRFMKSQEKPGNNTHPPRASHMSQE